MVFLLDTRISLALICCDSRVGKLLSFCSMRPSVEKVLAWEIKYPAGKYHSVSESLFLCKFEEVLACPALHGVT